MFLTLPSVIKPPHGFFMRTGGISEGIYESLNVGIGSADNPDHVNENRKLAVEALGFSESSLAAPRQFHSAESIFVDKPVRVKADAYVTNQKGLLLGIVTADCLPVLMWESSGIIAAVHAGWKGTIGGVLDNTIARITSIGGIAGNIHAVIGPAISASSYQVQADFYETVTTADDLATKFFRPDDKSEGYLFDLPSYAQQRLQILGVGHVENLNEDTLAQPDKFFSYRRSCLLNEADYGRQLSAIGLK